MTFPDSLMNKCDVAKLLRCCERTLERQVKLRAFPPPQKFGKESLWFETVVHGWLAKRQEEQMQWVTQSESGAATAPALASTVVQVAAALATPTKVGGTRVKARAAQSGACSMFSAAELAGIGRTVGGQ